MSYSVIELDRASQIADLRARLAEAEARCAAMSETLDLLADHHCGGLCGCGPHDDPPHDEVMRRVNAALSPDAGRKVLAVVEVARNLSGERACTDDGPGPYAEAWSRLDDALAALDGKGEE